MPSRAVRVVVGFHPQARRQSRPLRRALTADHRFCALTLKDRDFLAIRFPGLCQHQLGSARREDATRQLIEHESVEILHPYVATRAVRIALVHSRGALVITILAALPGRQRHACVAETTFQEAREQDRGGH